MSDVDLEVALQMVVETARALTGARHAALAVLTGEGRDLERLITAGAEPGEQQVITALPRGVDVPVTTRGVLCGNLYLTAKRFGEFDGTDQETALVLADWAASAILKARVFAAERALRAELDRSVQALATTTEIARAVAGETRVDHVLELIARRGRGLVQARGVVILLPSRDHLVVTAVAGALDRELLGERVPVAGSARVWSTALDERSVSPMHRARCVSRSPNGWARRPVCWSR